MAASALRFLLKTRPEQVSSSSEGVTSSTSATLFSLLSWIEGPGAEGTGDLEQFSFARPHRPSVSSSLYRAPCLHKKVKSHKNSNKQHTQVRKTLAGLEEKRGTNVTLKRCRAEFEFKYLNNAKHCLKAGEEVAYLSFPWRQVLKAFGFLEPRSFRPVKGKLIQEGRVVLVAANLEKFPVEAFV